jgi:effector-binding domain-containing protein
VSDYAIELRHVSRIQTAVIRHRIRPGEASRVVPRSCGLVWEALRAQQLRGGHNMALYRDCGLDVEAGVELTMPCSVQGEVVLSELPACTAASTSHFGPYDGLGAAHSAIQRWCKSNGHALSGVCWEIYGHWEHEWDKTPSKIRTDVYYAVTDRPLG